LRGVLAGALLCAAISFHASAGEFGLDLEAELGFEFANGLGHDHDKLRSSPVNFVTDFRYEYELLARFFYTTEPTVTGPVTFALTYAFDQRSYEQYNALHRERHRVDFSVTGSPQEGREFSTRFRWRRSQPEYRLGTIDLSNIWARMRLLERPIPNSSWLVRPYMAVEWETADFMRLDFLDRTEWTGQFGSQFRSTNNPLRTDVSVSYGDRIAESIRFTHEFVDVDVAFRFPISMIWDREWLAAANSSLSFSYREEWYEGRSADSGFHRHDREYQSILRLTRPMNERVTMGLRFEFEEHESNRTSSDFMESSAKVYWRVGL